jgi:hypothetical protein
LCYLTFDGPEPEVKLVANWHTERKRYNQKIMEGVFTWMSSYPSARTATASVHEEALRGRIDMLLPAAQVKMKPSGLVTRTVIYVTDLTALFIEPLEEVLSAFKLGPQSVPFRETCNVAARVVKSDSSIPVRHDGTVVLTDREWAVVAPLLLADFRTNSSIFDQKDLFDGLLEKFVLGLPWRTANYRSGTWGAAYQAYRTWTKQGTFEAAVSKLRSLRQQDH